MIEVNKFKIGIFVLSGIAVLISVIFIFGGRDLFKDEVTLVTICDDSVQGLEKGSQVKFRGVPVGKVIEIAIRQHDSKIMIKMQIDPAAFIVPSELNDAETIVSSQKEQGSNLRNFIHQQLKKGLQARLEYSGITGFKYIELNYFNADKDKLLPEPGNLKYGEIYIPTAPSMLSDAIQNISKSLENISKIKFDRISASLENTADKISKFIDDESVNNTIRNIEHITRKIDNNFSDEQIRIILADLQQTIGSLKNITSKVDNNVNDNDIKKIVSNLQKTTDSLHDIVDKLNKEKTVTRGMSAVTQAGNAVSRSADSLDSTLFKLSSTLDKLNILIELLNENPSALLRGKEAESSSIK